MISLADFVNVPSGGWLEGVETSSHPAGRGSCGDTNGTALYAYRDFWCPSARTYVSAHREYELSVVTQNG